MTPDRLREVLDILHWSQRDLAAVLGCDDRLARRWSAGAAGYPLPAPVADWLEALAGAHVANPPPQGWRGREAGADAKSSAIRA